MAAPNDILQFTMKGYFTNLSNQVMNVFQYQLQSPDPINFFDDGQTIIDEWRTDLGAVLAPLMGQEVQYNDLVIQNLSEPTEIWEGSFTTPLQGSVVGDVLPPYASWGFLLRRQSGVTRNGYKRFPGVPESLQINGTPTVGASTLLNALAVRLGDPYSIALVDPSPEIQLFPVIVRKDAAGLMTINQPVVGAVFRTLGTQNSRKIGRGI